MGVTGLQWEPGCTEECAYPHQKGKAGKKGQRKPDVIDLLSGRGRENAGNSHVGVLLTLGLISFNPHQHLKGDPCNLHITHEKTEALG